MDKHAEAIVSELCSLNEHKEEKAERKMKPILRLMAFAVSKGRSRVELAEDTGYGFQDIVRITSEKEFQAEVGRFVGEADEDLVQKRLDAAVLDGVSTLIELMNNPAVKDAIRVQSAMYIMNRVKGTPTQHIMTEKKSPMDPVTEMETLERELAQLKEVNKKTTYGTNESNEQLKEGVDQLKRISFS